VRETLKARKRFRLQNIQLVPLPEQCVCPQISN